MCTEIYSDTNTIRIYLSGKNIQYTEYSNVHYVTALVVSYCVAMFVNYLCRDMVNHRHNINSSNLLDSKSSSSPISTSLSSSSLELLYMFPSPRAKSTPLSFPAINKNKHIKYLHSVEQSLQQYCSSDYDDIHVLYF